MHTIKITAASFLALLPLPSLAESLLTGLNLKATSAESSLPYLGEEKTATKSRSFEIKERLKEIKVTAKKEMREVGRVVEHFVFQGQFHVTELDLTMQSAKELMTVEYKLAGIETRSVFNPVKGSVKTKIGENLLVNIKNVSSNPELKVQYSLSW